MPLWCYEVYDTCFPGFLKYTREEIAGHPGIKKDTVYKWHTEKDIPSQKVGQLWKFKISEIDEWVKTGRARNNNK